MHGLHALLVNLLLHCDIVSFLSSETTITSFTDNGQRRLCSEVLLVSMRKVAQNPLEAGLSKRVFSRIVKLSVSHGYKLLEDKDSKNIEGRGIRKKIILR